MAAMIHSRPVRCRGFTLIEIAVVLLLLVIVIGTIGIELHATDRVTARDQSKRLALLVHALRQQAIMEGQAFGIRLDAHGYGFVVLNVKGHWKPLTRDALFRARRFPGGLVVSVVISGATARSLIEISPSGILTPFTATFREGDARWKVTGMENGDVTATPGH